MGLKGTGKTKTLIDGVNAAVAENHGSVVCIEKGTKLRYDVSHQARLISADEYKIDDYEKFFGFVNGILAANFDIPVRQSRFSYIFQSLCAYKTRPPADFAHLPSLRLSRNLQFRSL